MGLKDKFLDFVAGHFGPTMDHPGAGGMTGDDYEPADAEEPEATEESADEENES